MIPKRPGLKAFIGRNFLRYHGWDVQGGPPGVKKAVVVAAPHTSNWDWPFTIAVAWALGVEMRWVGKHTLFKRPWGTFMRFCGGISVDRKNSKNFVQSVVSVLDAHDELFLVIAPEGTRSKTSRWKTGFYHMARGANVPVVLGFLDYQRKVGGMGELFYPSGDLEKDAEHLRAFYKDIVGTCPGNTAEISFTGEGQPMETTPPPAAIDEALARATTIATETVATAKG